VPIRHRYVYSVSHQPGLWAFTERFYKRLTARRTQANANGSTFVSTPFPRRRSRGVGASASAAMACRVQVCSTAVAALELSSPPEGILLGTPSADGVDCAQMVRLGVALDEEQLLRVARAGLETLAKLHAQGYACSPAVTRPQRVAQMSHPHLVASYGLQRVPFVHGPRLIRQAPRLHSRAGSSTAISGQRTSTCPSTSPRRTARCTCSFCGRARRRGRQILAFPVPLLLHSTLLRSSCTSRLSRHCVRRRALAPRPQLLRRHCATWTPRTGSRTRSSLTAT
jgi:hypothetical protein